VFHPTSRDLCRYRGGPRRVDLSRPIVGPRTAGIGANRKQAAPKLGFRLAPKADIRLVPFGLLKSRPQAVIRTDETAEFDEIYIEPDATPPVVLDGKADDVFDAIIKKRYRAIPFWDPGLVAAWLCAERWPHAPERRGLAARTRSTPANLPRTVTPIDLPSRIAKYLTAASGFNHPSPGRA
jgi:hypothetical protein